MVRLQQSLSKWNFHFSFKILLNLLICTHFQLKQRLKCVNLHCNLNYHYKCSMLHCWVLWSKTEMIKCSRCHIWRVKYTSQIWTRKWYEYLKLINRILLWHAHCSHPFGGLVFFLSPGKQGSPLTVDVHGVIQAPVFDIRKENYLQLWKYTRDASGLSQWITSDFPKWRWQNNPQLNFP